MTIYRNQLRSKRNYDEQLQRMIDQSFIVENIDEMIKMQSKEYEVILKLVSEEQTEIMKANTELVCGSIEHGFELISLEIESVNRTLNDYLEIFESRTRMILDELKYHTIILENIALLTKEPDSQKERAKFIEKGLKFLNDANKDHTFYEDALIFFKKAEEIDHTDYHVLYKIGLIYLYSNDQQNIEESIKYFEKAAKYSNNDSHPDSIILSNILAVNISESYLDYKVDKKDIKFITYQSYIQISIAYYKLEMFDKAIEFSKLSNQIIPEILEGKYLLAKYLACSGENKKAAKILKNIIIKNRKYILRVLKDVDLATVEVKEMLEQLYNDLNPIVINQYNICVTTIKKNSYGQKLLNTIGLLIERQNYLSILAANDLLNTKFSYSINNSIAKDENNYWIDSIKTRKFNFDLKELIAYENSLLENTLTVKKLIDKIEHKKEIEAELKDLESIKSKYSSERYEEEKGIDLSLKFGIPGVITFIIGLILIRTNHEWGELPPTLKAFGQGFLGVVLLIGGAFGSLWLIPLFFSLINFVGAKINHESYSSKIKNIKIKIDELDNEIHEIRKS